jgi:hypothetical protein
VNQNTSNTCNFIGTPWDANLLVKRKLYPLFDSLGIEHEPFDCTRNSLWHSRSAVQPDNLRHGCQFQISG